MYFKTLPLTDISIALRNNTLALDKYISDTCRRIEEVDSLIQALLPEKNRERRLLKEAEALLKKYPSPAQRPPLFGVLVGIKDLFNVDGMRTKAGSKLPAQAFKGEEAPVAKRLRGAGALILGKTVTTEFAYFKPGPTKNPHNPDYSPGGSSSGSAAAVAEGVCPLALGTQTIASVIRPATYCGIIGFKPSFGRISTAGIFPFSQSVDTVGFFTQDMAGIALAAGILVEDWDPHIRSVSQPKIFIPSDAFLVQAHYDAFNRFYEKVDVLAGRGYEVVNYPLFRDIAKINNAHRELIAAEFAQNHKQLYAEYGELYSEQSVELYNQGKKISRNTLETHLQFQQTCKQNIAEIMHREGVDIWVCPSAASEAPRGQDYTGSPLMSLPWTFTGLPSITLPVSKSAHNLPLGLQVIAGYGKDEQLLQYSAEIFNALSY